MYRIVSNLQGFMRLSSIFLRDFNVYKNSYAILKAPKFGPVPAGKEVLQSHWLNCRFFKKSFVTEKWDDGILRYNSKKIV